MTMPTLLNHDDAVSPLATTRQIATFLKTCGVEQYAHCFAENDIDSSVLRDLTDQDLEKIGIQSLGHRRKLLRAIADLKDVDKSPSAVAVAPAAPCRAALPGRRRAAPNHGDVHRPCWLDGTLRPYG